MNRTPLKRKTPLNRYSIKKIAELNAEAPIRLELCRRAHGIPKEHIQKYRRKGVIHEIHRVICRNGICECGCGQRYPVLEPHEKVFRSHGGKLSLDNSILLSRECHQVAQNNVLKWTPIQEGGF